MSQKSLPPDHPINSSEDRLFARHTEQSFRFDEKVVNVFPDMIDRSVPGYNLIVPMLGLLARRFVQPDSNIYDLGCSLGASSLAISDAVNTFGVKIIAVDNSAAMISRLAELMLQHKGNLPIEVRQENIENTAISHASLVILNFTLQFIELENRLPLIKQIYDNLLPGGALLLSEKISFSDPQNQQLQTEWHHDFKRSQGYSDLEIANKRNALENVLIPETLETHRERLGQAGFTTVIPWFQCFNFISLVAIKTKNDIA
ncbi:MAG: carboxy-S-adenosyl-L-methionine synthase CmoA [Xanthomonadales bacterium]|nr:carboxy-S-adenosyl-L-methionine synthase CmoA [Xanthomonadales bacterium]